MATSPKRRNILEAQAADHCEQATDQSLRPQRLAEFIGQTRIREQLEVFIAAACRRRQPLDHVLLVSPPGLGKTTLATVIANEMGAGMRVTSGPALERPGDAAAALTALQSGDVLFIDEIHRLHPAIEESMYSALEDRRFDVMVGDGSAAAAAVSLDLEPFTLVGATTRAGMMTSPLRDRFGIQLRLDFYPVTELAEIVRRSAGLLDTPISDEAIVEIAGRSRGTPRIANRLLRRVRDFAQVRGSGRVDLDAARQALKLLEVDERGLDAIDMRYLETLAVNFGGGPAGVETLAVAISESPDTIENFIEPFLIQQGYVARTPRGRIGTERIWKLLGIRHPKGSLLDDT